jgi:hypothetical protein
LDLLFVGPRAFRFTAGRGLGHTGQMLEILAAVKACPHRSFDELGHLVLDHLSAVSGCVCVLLAWDEARRELVRRIRALEIPVLVLIIVPAGAPTSLDPGPLRDEPWRFRALEAGRIEQGLAEISLEAF